MTSITEFLIAKELVSLHEIAKDYGWKLEVLDSKSFVIGFTASNKKVYWCKVICEGYKILPPRWHWYDPVSNSIDEPNNFPKVTVPGAKNYFHPHGFICAPWNQLSYGFHAAKGLHFDWNLVAWQSNPLTGACLTLSSMAIQIHQELRNKIDG